MVVDIDIFEHMSTCVHVCMHTNLGFDLLGMCGLGALGPLGNLRNAA